MVPTYTLQAQLAFLVQAAAAGPPAVSAGPLHGALLQLFTNSPALFAPNALAAALVLPTYTGYVAAQAVTWATPFVNPVLQGEVSGGIFNFACTATGAPSVITGAALIDSTSTDILGIDVFANPITITNDFDGFTYFVRWVLQGM